MRLDAEVCCSECSEAKDHVEQLRMMKCIVVLLHYTHSYSSSLLT
jgi:hypothetical protein